MKLRPIGLYDEDGSGPYRMDPSDFSDRSYDGIQLRKARNGMPVIIMQSKRTAPLMWKVVYGFSEVYFRSFAEAVEFCNSRGMEIMKGEVD